MGRKPTFNRLLKIVLGVFPTTCEGELTEIVSEWQIKITRSPGFSGKNCEASLRASRPRRSAPAHWSSRRRFCTIVV
jgi:hypothetical protein